MNRRRLHRADRSPNGLVNAAAEQLIAGELAAVERRHEAAWIRHVGFPASSDIGHSALAAILTRVALNNIGDPFADGLIPNHTKEYERRVLDLAAELFRAPHGGWWGAVTGGSTEGNLMGVLCGRTRFPRAIVMHSAAAHYSVAKAAHILAMPTAVVAANPRGEMDYGDLREKLRQHRHRQPVIVATAGTTMSEACDSVTDIDRVCRAAGIAPDQRHLHVDAALSGIPLALLPVGQRPSFDLADGADSIVTSGHKFLSTLMPSGIFLVKSSARGHARGVTVDYIGGIDSTISGSRSGHLPLLLWHALRRHGLQGLQLRAQHARQLAAYTERRLFDLGWPVWRNPHAFTVMIQTPPPQVTQRWALPSSGGWSHLITMPGVTRVQVDLLIADLAAHLPRRPTAPAGPALTVARA